jgi:hypothetical protein
MATTSLPLTPSGQNHLDQINHELDLLEEENHRSRPFARVQQRVAMFERIYEMPSDEMISRLDAGDLEETDDICVWRMEIDLLNHVASSH